MRNSRPVLLVEDDEVDALAVKRAFKDLHVTNPVAHIGDGEQALAYLRDSTNPKPCIILLDLNMPKMGGIEFLGEIKQDDQLREIPTVVFTTSGEEFDVVKSYELSAGGYMIKPVDYKKFVEVIRTVDLYWTISELPCQKNGGQNGQ